MEHEFSQYSNDLLSDRFLKFATISKIDSMYSYHSIIICKPYNRVKRFES